MWKLLISLLVLSSQSPGSRSQNLDENGDDPDYGKTWMYFPDGDGVPRVANLTDDVPSDKSGSLESYVTFQLYTRRNKDNYSELVFDEGSNEVDNNLIDSRLLQNDYFDPKKEVKIITHGWLSNGESPSVLLIKNAYLEDRDCNVIVVDWEPIAKNYLYFIPAYNTRFVGRKTGKLIEYLVREEGLSLDQFHMIGHSLGSHVSGFAGSSIKSGKMARITGLDPAKPGFEDVADPANRLDDTDAKFVDIIHTSAGTLGFYNPLGDADFYPNGGTPPQPGCEGLFQTIEACSHGRSYEFFAESIRTPYGFKSLPCPGANAAREGECGETKTKENKSRSIPLMGDKASPKDVGVFYLKTNPEPPFAKS